MHSDRLRCMTLLGLPGCGKGTVGELLEKKLGFGRLSLGEIIREEIQKNSAFGRKIHAVVKRGELIDDHLLVEKMLEVLKSKRFRKGIIFDGSPRNSDQAALMEKKGLSPQVAVFLDCAIEILVERLSNRWVCPVCQEVYNLVSSPPKRKGFCDHDSARLVQREDDTPAVIRRRIALNKKLTGDILDFYKDRGVLARVDATGTPSAILKRVLKVLPRYNKT